MLATAPTTALTHSNRQREPLSADVRCHLAATGLILLSVVLNLAYLLFDCPLDLAPDEAHYWHWSRHLDWSYYSKGPLAAWLIRGSCELFGGISVQLVGTEMLAVRLPAVLSQALLLAGLYVLAGDALRSARAALGTVAFALTLPAISAAGVLMTIDPPFLACWCWALVGVMKANRAKSHLGWWLFAGVCSALGVLAKYPMLLLPLAVGGFLFTNRRREYRKPGFWAFVGITLLGAVPVLLWNAANDWVSFRHVLGQTGGNATGFRWLGPLAFAGGQFALLLGFWFVGFAIAAWRYRKSSDSALSLLWWSSVPVWGVFALASFLAEGQVNWPAAAYVGGFVLTMAWVRTQRFAARGVAITTVFGVCISVVAHYPGSLTALAASVSPVPTESKRFPIRSLDPTTRLRGWQTLAREVDGIRDRVKRETGQDPVIAGMVWTTPGELAFYCRGHPETYSFGLALADRHSQYDLWRPNPVADAQVFRGRTFLYVGEQIPDMEAVFDSVEMPIQVIHRERGIPIAGWTIWVGHGFHGFEQTRIGSGKPKY